jgi:hypothetical protein
MSKFNLSDKIYPMFMVDGVEEHNYEMIDKEDVKEFIRLLKEETAKAVIKGDNFYNDELHYWMYKEDFYRIIDKLAGDKLK